MPMFYSFPKFPRHVVVLHHDGEWGSISPSCISSLLDNVDSVLELPWGSRHLSNTCISVLREHNADHPSSWPKSGLIYLTALDGFYCKYIFQYAHELCHVLIGKGFLKKHQWFEEVLCEVSSQFALSRIASTWKHSPFPYAVSGYHAAVLDYLNDRALSAHPLDPGVSINDFFTASIASLEADSCIRNINTLFANRILPTFLRNDSLWSSVPFMCDAPASSTFREFLLHWEKKCPSGLRPCVDEISSIFFPD